MLEHPRPRSRKVSFMTREVEHEEVRASIRRLLAEVTVTNVETGKPLDRQAKLGRVIAACRGYEATLVLIDWGTTSPEAVREALDALRGAE